MWRCCLLIRSLITSELSSAPALLRLEGLVSSVSLITSLTNTCMMPGDWSSFTHSLASCGYNKFFTFHKINEGTHVHITADWCNSKSEFWLENLHFSNGIARMIFSWDGKKIPGSIIHTSLSINTRYHQIDVSMQLHSYALWYLSRPCMSNV